MSPRLRSLLAAGLAAALGALAAGQAQAQAAGGCRLMFDSGPDQWLIRFDPLSENAAMRQFDVAVTNTGDAPCITQARVDLRGDAFGLSKPGDGQRLAYVLTDERSGADVTPRAGLSTARAGARSVTVGPGERTLMRFAFGTAPTGYLGAGLYAQDAFVSLQSLDGVVLAEKPVTLGLDIPSVALMGLKGEVHRRGGVATIDLGELARGRQSLATSLYVISTAGYSVEVTSANGGRLRHSTGDWWVGYGLSVGNHVVDLERGDRIDVVSGRPRFDDYPFTVSIGSVEGQRAGDYSDILTFTIAAI